MYCGGKQYSEKCQFHDLRIVIGSFLNVLFIIHQSIDVKIEEV